VRDITANPEATWNALSLPIGDVPGSCVSAKMKMYVLYLYLTGFGRLLHFPAALCAVHFEMEECVD
jgi:hypothetical protein